MSPNDSDLKRPLFIGLLTVAALPRILAAIFDHGIFWPDEIYQTMEPAHRLAFGCGLLPWEFRDGARSWILPGIIGGIWKLAALIGFESSLWRVVSIKLLMVLSSLFAVGAAIKIALSKAGTKASVLTGIAAGFFPPFLILSHRCLSEIAGVSFVTWTTLLLLAPTRSSGKRAGLLAGFAWLIRFQNLAVVAPLAVVLAIRKEWRRLLVFLAALCAMVFFGGLFDWVTLGAPFHSLKTYLAFNLLQSGADAFGTESPIFYLRHLWLSGGYAAPIVFAGILVGVFRAPDIGFVVLAYLVLHSLVPHKELRFVVPIMPLLGALCGIGWTALLQKQRSYFVYLAIGISLAVLSLNQARSMTLAQMGRPRDTHPNKAESIWANGEINLALRKAGQQSDVCGLGVIGYNALWTGGYSYFNNPSPLVFRDRLCGLESTVNYLILSDSVATSPLPEGFVEVWSQGTAHLFRRAGPCASAPNDFTGMLPGSDELGLHRPRPSRRDSSIFEVDAGKGCGCFEKGWGTPILVGCLPIRPVTQRTATLQFDISPHHVDYEAEITMIGFEAFLPQTMEIRLNEQFISTFSLFPGRLSYRTTIAPGRLTIGSNLLTLTFTRTFESPGNGIQAAAFIEKIQIAPSTKQFGK